MKTFFHALMVALPVAATGCYVHDGPPPQRQVVAYRVEQPPPPPPRVEVVTVSPGPEYVWVGGYHRWSGRAYNWVPGHYERRHWR